MLTDSIEAGFGVALARSEAPANKPLVMDLELLQSISLAVSEVLDVEAILKMIVTGLVDKAGFALARIWLRGPGDACSSCRMSAECQDRSTCLHLAASAGHSQVDSADWSGLDGAFRRFPFQARKIGWIGSTGESVRVDDSVAESRWPLHPDWVSKEDIRGFAGHPLIFRGQILGVLGVFARASISEQQFGWLRVFADQAAVSIANARAFEEIKTLKDQLHTENLALKEEIDETSMFEEIVGASDSLKKMLGQVRRVAPTDSTTLILGETGTGKELIARAIHRQSNRSRRAFIRVNCAAIPESLIASELFGHERGAFTGALQRRAGRFELADGGTIFLDEVGELPPDTQVALLRVLQEREFERIGGTQSVRVDVRVIAATNRDLQAAVATGAFRLDLFYRLNVFPIQVPSLKERKSDIRLLLEYFIKRYSSQMGKEFRSVNKRTLDLFQGYDWPGNIRELQNVVERSVILSSGDVFSVDESWFCREPAQQASPSHYSVAEGRDDYERTVIEAALLESRGRVAGPTGAAAKLRIPRSTLESRIKALSIRKTRFKHDAAEL